MCVTAFFEKRTLLCIFVNIFFLRDLSLDRRCRSLLWRRCLRFLLLLSSALDSSEEEEVDVLDIDDEMPDEENDEPGRKLFEHLTIDGHLGDFTEKMV